MLCGMALAQANPDSVVVNNVNVGTGVGPSSLFPNVGQTSHLLFYCSSNSPGGGAIQIALEGSFDNSNWTQISNYGTQVNNCETLYATGYWPFVRANTYQRVNPAAVTFAYYSGTKQNVLAGAMNSPITAVQPVPTTYASSTNVRTGANNFVFTSSTTYFYGADITNLTAGAVYITLPNINLLVVPAGSTVQYRLPQPIVLTAGLGAVACSTSSAGPVDPAANTCQVTAYYRDQPQLKSLVNNAGTASRTGGYNTF